MVKQSPDPGKSVKVGTLVTIYISQGGTAVPDVVGDNYQVAIGKLSNAGLTNISEVFVQNPQLANGTVVQQNPRAGDHVSPGKKITLTVVKNAADPVADAKLTVADAELTVAGAELTVPSARKQAVTAGPGQQ